MKAQDFNSCKESYPIVIDMLGRPLPEVQSKYSLHDQEDNFVLYYPESGDPKSFWYHIKVYQACKIEFVINPLGKENWYNFFIYKDPKEGVFCENLFNYKIVPIRTNLLKENMEGGVGLSSGKEVIVQNATNAEKWEYVYHTAYHNPIEAKAGEDYYINVYHVKGNDCGHQLQLNIDGYYQGFTTVHHHCYDLPVSKVDPIIPVTNPALLQVVNKPVEKNFKNLLVLKLDVLDSVKQKRIPAVIKIKTSKKTSKEKLNEEGENGLLLEGALFYELEISAIGYKTKKLKVLKQTLKHEIRQQTVYMKPLEKGENFILDDIYFYSGTYAFKPISDTTLGQLYEYLHRNPEIKIEIQGHTNGKGKIRKSINTSNKGPEWNFHGNEKKLSKMRAEEVKGYLRDLGIEENRIKTNGLGAQKMLYPKPRSKKERDLNKRVEIYIL